jgi:hypothetical protein
MLRAVQQSKWNEVTAQCSPADAAKPSEVVPVADAAKPSEVVPVADAAKPGEVVPQSASIVPADKQLKDSLSEYQRRYNPPNFNRLTQELDSFREMLNTCKRHGIRCVVVNMPITKQNKGLLNSDLYQQYIVGISSIARKNSAVYMDLDDQMQFSLSDFSDSVHTNARGGKKVQDELANRLHGVM